MSVCGPGVQLRSHQIEGFFKDRFHCDFEKNFCQAPKEKREEMEKLYLTLTQINLSPFHLILSISAIFKRCFNTRLDL